MWTSEVPDVGLCLYSVLLTEWTNDCQRVENIPMNVRVEELVHLINNVPQSPHYGSDIRRPPLRRGRRLPQTRRYQRGEQAKAAR